MDTHRIQNIITTTVITMIPCLYSIGSHRINLTFLGCLRRQFLQILWVVERCQEEQHLLLPSLERSGNTIEFLRLLHVRSRNNVTSRDSTPRSRDKRTHTRNHKRSMSSRTASIGLNRSINISCRSSNNKTRNCYSVLRLLGIEYIWHNVKPRLVLVRFP